MTRTARLALLAGVIATIALVVLATATGAARVGPVVFWAVHREEVAGGSEVALRPGLGLLVLQHRGRIRLFGQDAEPLFQRYLQQLLLRLDPQGEAARAESPFEAAAPGSQPDLFGP